MNNQDWESRINELRDAQLVAQRLMEKLERKVDEHEDGIAEKRSAITTSASHGGELHEATGELQAAMISLVAQIDRFVQGRGSNGHQKSSRV